MAEQQEGRWVTLDNGVHLFIKKGQTLDDAIEQNISKEKKEEQKDYDNLSAREYGQKYAKTEKPQQKEEQNTKIVSEKVKKAKEYFETWGQPNRNELQEVVNFYGLTKDEAQELLGGQFKKEDIDNLKFKETKSNAEKKETQKQPNKDPKRYDNEEYSQLEMYDHVEEDLGLDWHDVKQIYFLENTFEENPKNAVVELENGDYIEYNVQTGERKDVKGEDWVDPWNRRTGFGQKATEYIKKKK